jgi:uncharacterized protein
MTLIKESGNILFGPLNGLNQNHYKYMNNIMIEENVISIIKNADFKCQRCSICCRIDPGTIFLTKEDSIRISKFLDLELEVFFKTYCYNIIKGSKRLVSIKEKPNYDCIFWENGCTIYKARPIQCRTYPYWPSVVKSRYSWDEESKRCCGINKKSSLSLEDKIKLYSLEHQAVHFEYKI